MFYQLLLELESLQKALEGEAMDKYIDNLALVGAFVSLANILQTI